MPRSARLSHSHSSHSPHSANSISTESTALNRDPDGDALIYDFLNPQGDDAPDAFIPCYVRVGENIWPGMQSLLLGAMLRFHTTVFFCLFIAAGVFYSQAVEKDYPIWLNFFLVGDLNFMLLFGVRLLEHLWTMPTAMMHPRYRPNYPELKGQWDRIPKVDPIFGINSHIVEFVFMTIYTVSQSFCLFTTAVYWMVLPPLEPDEWNHSAMMRAAMYSAAAPMALWEVFFLNTFTMPDLKVLVWSLLVGMSGIVFYLDAWLPLGTWLVGEEVRIGSIDMRAIGGAHRGEVWKPLYNDIFTWVLLSMAIALFFDIVKQLLRDFLGKRQNATRLDLV